MTGAPLRVGVLASGEGTNLQALLDGVHRRDAEIVAVASDQPGARALERAQAAGVPVATFALRDHADRGARDAAIADWLSESRVELVVLAGYMARLDAAFVGRFPGRIINVHPSLLPAFAGLHAIEQALDYGVSITGVTVHFVDEGLDTGPVILQRAVNLSGNPVATAVRELLRPVEHELLVRAVRLIAAGAVTQDPHAPRRVLVDGSAVAP